VISGDKWSNWSIIGRRGPVNSGKPKLGPVDDRPPVGSIVMESARRGRLEIHQ
jgi:hypothetical protein